MHIDKGTHVYMYSSQMCYPYPCTQGGQLIHSLPLHMGVDEGGRSRILTSNN